MSGPLKGKKVLVTGGTGSIGSEIVRQALAQDPAVVRVYSRDEGKQFDLQQELRAHDNVRYLIGDIRDRERLRRALEDIDVIFHAAALKHVPACEFNPFEAVKTNVLGVQNLIEAALDEEVEKVIAISTDKVANPTNTMGATKLLSERLIAAANYYKGSRRTVFSCVRFGNVVGSRGSVIPLFHEQIRRGGPVTVTDPEMTRFMMTIPQAVQLVLRAAEMAQGGETFILKMPVVRLGDLVAAMLDELAPRYGFPPRAVPVEIIGLRPGEKKDEELMTEEEAGRALELPDMFVILPMIRTGRYEYRGARPATVRRYASCDQPCLSKDEVFALLLARLLRRRASDWPAGTAVAEAAAAGEGRA